MNVSFLRLCVLVRAHCLEKMNCAYATGGMVMIVNGGEPAFPIGPRLDLRFNSSAK